MQFIRRIAQIAGLQPKPLQVVVCGMSRSGTTLLYNMLRSTVAGAVAPDRERPATRHLRDFRPLVITKRPLDVLRIDHIIRKNRGRKRLHFVLCIRDPRALVSSTHNAWRGFFQGYDYCIQRRKGLPGYTGPGVVQCAVAIDNAAKSGLPYSIVRYEDVVSDPNAVQSRLASEIGLTLNGKFEDVNKSPIPERLSFQLNGVRPIDQEGVVAWQQPDRRQRVYEQFSEEPALFDLLERWGYETDRHWFDPLDKEFAGQEEPAGTVVGYHTTDEVYTHEARRLEASAKRLGLGIDLTPVDSAGSWVRNASQKARFLRDVRDRLPGRLLYLDVDAIVIQDPWPYLKYYRADMAVHVRYHGQLASGTILLNDTPGCREALAEWTRRCEQRPDERDQDVLQEVVEEFCRDRPNISFDLLTPNFCSIFVNPDEPPLYGEPVIEHLQASRENKLRGLKRLTSRKKTLLNLRDERVRAVEQQLGMS